MEAPLVGATIRTAALGSRSYVVAVAGELDLASTPEVEANLRHLEALGGTRFVLDLSSVTFLDSTGLGLLLRGAKRAERDGGRFLVVTCDPRLLRTFSISGTDRMIDVRDGLAEALEVVRLDA